MASRVVPCARGQAIGKVDEHHTDQAFASRQDEERFWFGIRPERRLGIMGTMHVLLLALFAWRAAELLLAEPRPRGLRVAHAGEDIAGPRSGIDAADPSELRDMHAAMDQTSSPTDP